jgi:cation:H+ antiporter
MPQLPAWALLFLGAGLLYLGAEWLVRGSSGLAAKLKVRPLVIGLTVVAYGTSAPELVVGVGAALSGRGGIAFGNAVGSNIANIGLILGMTSILSPPRIDGSLRTREVPILIVSALAIPIMLLDGRLTRLEGAGLVAAALAYTYLMLRASRRATASVIADTVEVASDAALASAENPISNTPKLVVLAALGLGLLLLGGEWFVDGASQVALLLGLSERLVGLTIVSVGTSLPELATSLIAARRGHSEIAVGNVIGSNIFNALLILGASGLAGPLEVDLRESVVEVSAVLAMTLVAAFLLRAERHIRRAEGSALVALYVVFLVFAASAGRGR